MDLGDYPAAIPSFIQWTLGISTILQLITVSVYGSQGIGNYTLYQPDYSLILAAVATGLSGIATILFIVETECSSKSRILKGYTTQ